MLNLGYHSFQGQVDKDDKLLRKRTDVGVYRTHVFYQFAPVLDVLRLDKLIAKKVHSSIFSFIHSHN